MAGEPAGGQEEESMRESSDSLNTRRSIEIGGTMLHYYSLDATEDGGAGAVTRLPRSLQVLYENLLRHEDGLSVRRAALQSAEELRVGKECVSWLQSRCSPHNYNKTIPHD